MDIFWNYTLQNLDEAILLLKCGLKSQLVKHRTSIAEVIGLNPFET